MKSATVALGVLVWFRGQEFGLGGTVLISGVLVWLEHCWFGLKGLICCFRHTDLVSRIASSC